MTTSKTLNAMTKSQAATNRKGGRPRVTRNEPRQPRPSYYVWPKCPEGTKDLQAVMGAICGFAEAVTSNLDQYGWMKIIYQIWSCRNAGNIGVSYGTSSLAAIGNSLESIGQRKFSSGGM